MRFQLKPIALALLIASTSSPLIAMSGESSMSGEPAKPGSTSVAPSSMLASQIQNDISARQALLAAWENGDITQVKTIAEQYRLSDVLLAEAYEALGDKTSAIGIYSTLADRAGLNGSEQLQMKIQLALLQDKPDILKQIARNNPKLAENVALVVGISSGISKAIPILESIENKSLPSQLVFTNWLLEIAESDRAEKLAWRAFEQAETRSDKRYALALFAEAVRINGRTEAVLDTLSGYHNDPFLTPLYLDFLLEEGKFSEALALTETSTLPAIKSRNAALLSLSDDQHGLTTFYRQQIQANPTNPEGYYGLAGQLINEGDLTGAKQVFDDFGSVNAGKKSLLLAAAQRMIAMNMQDSAIAMLQTRVHDAQADPDVNYFLFKTYLAAGDEASARMALDNITASTQAQSPSRLLVVTALEQLDDVEQALQVLLNFRKAGGRLSYDQRLHLAELARNAGSEDLAVAEWETLWQQATLPARKFYLENLLVKATQKAGTLENKVTELEQLLENGGLSDHELNLLVALHLADNQTDKAESAINNYATKAVIPETQRLELLASLFGRSRQYARLNEIWKQLAERDPANASQYWQQITLNSLRNNAYETTKSNAGETPQEQRLAQVNTLIASLTENGNQDDHAFVASIYTLAGLTEQAITEYRKAIDTNTNPDALLQLVELYKKSSQFELAVRLLQTRLVSAPTDTAYMNTVDGLLNLFDSTPDQREDKAAPSLKNRTLNWLTRQILTRLVVSGSDISLLMVLSDIKQSQGDFDTAEHISNLILAASDTQRAALLRSLISQFSGKDPYSQSSGPAIGDEQKKLKYGRRLLALQHDFPPALYADLGRSLLADGDVQGAERAFSLMTEIPGILNVKQLKGDAYASQHMDSAALTYFKEALLVDQSNFELLRKTAILEEQFNDKNMAEYWYWQGLKRIISQAPLHQPDFSTMRTSDSFKFFPTLSEGLLLTINEAQAKTVMQALQSMLKVSLKSLQQHADAAPLGKVSEYPRITFITDLMQRIASSRHSQPQWQSALSDLTPIFADFTPLALSPLGDQQTLDVLAHLKNQAQVEDNFKLTLALAIDSNDWHSVIELASSLTARLRSNGEFTPIVGGNYFDVLRSAADKMPNEQFKKRFWPVMIDVPNQKLLMLQLQRYLPETVRKLEAKLSAPLLTDAEFISLTIQHINTPPLAGLPYAMNDDSFNKLLFSKLSPKDLLELWEKTERSYRQTGATNPIREEIVQRVFAKPVSPDHREQVAKLLHSYVTANGNNLAPCAAMAERVMVLSAAAENQPFLQNEATKIAGISVQCEQLPHFLTAFFEGDKTEAFDALLKLTRAAGAGVHFQAFADVTYRYLRDERLAYITEFLAAPQIAADDARFFINNILPTENQTSNQLDYLTALHRQLPANELIFNRLINLLWRERHFDTLETVISARLQNNANDDDQHLQYFLHQINAKGAGKETAQIGKPVADIVSLVGWLNKSMSAGAQDGGTAALYSLIFTEYARRFPADPLVVELKRREGGNQVAAPESVSQPDIARLVKVYNQNRSEGLRQLNTLWRNGIEGGQQFDGKRLGREQLIHVIYDSEGLPVTDNSSEDFLAHIANVPEATVMFNNWLIALPAEQRSSMQRLYDVIARGWSAQGNLDEHIANLLSQLDEPDVTAHHLQLLATALPLSSITPDTHSLTMLRAQIAKTQNASVYLRLGLANVFSRAKQYQEAGELVVAAVWQMNYPTLTMETRIVQSRFNAPSLSDAVAQLSSWNNGQVAASYLAQVFHISQRMTTDSQAAKAYWQAFTLMAQAKLGIETGEPITEMIDDKGDEISPVVEFAIALYTRDVLGDDSAAINRVLQALESPTQQSDINGYDREADALLSQLFGPSAAVKNQQSLLPWFDMLIKDASDDWKQSLRLAIADSALNDDIKDQFADKLTVVE